jgi:hypothetical protein
VVNEFSGEPQATACVLAGQAPENASAEDAWRASLLSHAAIRSRDTGEVVKMEES